MIRRLRIRWALRKSSDDEIREMLTLVILAGRRCTHDLGHALSELPSLPADSWRCSIRDRLHSKYHHWMKVFYPDDGAKNYRGRLHREIDEVVRENDRLEKLCRANGIDPTNPDGIPF